MFCSVHSITVTKLETSSSHQSTVLNYKVDLGSNKNLMPVNMFKMLITKNSNGRTS